MIEIKKSKRNWSDIIRSVERYSYPSWTHAKVDVVRVLEPDFIIPALGPREEAVYVPASDDAPESIPAVVDASGLLVSVPPDEPCAILVFPDEYAPAPHTAYLYTPLKKLRVLALCPSDIRGMIGERYAPEAVALEYPRLDKDDRLVYPDTLWNQRHRLELDYLIVPRGHISDSEIVEFAKRGTIVITFATGRRLIYLGKTHWSHNPFPRHPEAEDYKEYPKASIDIRSIWAHWHDENGYHQIEFSGGYLPTAQALAEMERQAIRNYFEFNSPVDWRDRGD